MYRGDDHESLTSGINADARIEVQPGEKGERLTTGAAFFLDGDRIVAALGNVANPNNRGEERMFIVDAGGQQTCLTSRYYAEHAAISLTARCNCSPYQARKIDRPLPHMLTTPTARWAWTSWMS